MERKVDRRAERNRGQRQQELAEHQVDPAEDKDGEKSDAEFLHRDGLQRIGHDRAKWVEGDGTAASAPYRPGRKSVSPDPELRCYCQVTYCGLGQQSRQGSSLLRRRLQMADRRSKPGPGEKEKRVYETKDLSDA